MDIIQAITQELKVEKWQVEAAVKLIDEGNTIPFISRYRKEATGSLNDEQLCAQYGLPREIAYSMSDIFIQRMDVCKKKEEVDKIQTEMIMSYTKAMQDNRSKGIYSKQIVKCVDYIQANLQQELRLESIAEYLNMNPTYLSRLFKKEMDVSISAYIKTERLKTAAHLLQYSNYSISEISEYLNFSSQSHFTSSFQELYGLTPKKYRDLHTSCESPDLEEYES